MDSQVTPARVCPLSCRRLSLSRAARAAHARPMTVARQRCSATSASEVGPPTLRTLRARQGSQGGGRKSSRQPRSPSATRCHRPEAGASVASGTACVAAAIAAVPTPRRPALRGSSRSSPPDGALDPRRAGMPAPRPVREAVLSPRPAALTGVPLLGTPPPPPPPAKV